ncbi:MAG: SWIM zinc finger domain-containing protein, partial [Chloroflexota bacterium]|nr:SWIM zinc finger domain-containing protein [Chloroflexota bacterium]
PELREELLARLRARTTTFDLAAPVDIFLHEGLVDDAIAVLDANPTTTAYQVAVVERVADAAIQTRPEWVVQTVRRQAERIMDGGKSQYYREAARWLERMREAAAGAGRTDEWRAYINELLATHKRKYSLVPLLKQVLGEPQRR